MKKDATALNLATPESAAAVLELRIGVPRHPPYALAIKRLVDVVVSVLALVAGAPFIALVALFIKVTSPGPIFFRQIRLGKDGMPFMFYKFRTMHHGNDDSVHRSFCESFINGNGNKKKVFKMVADPRVTRIGRFLRKTSLDELPQLWNVARGEMSLVGPRPPISYELEHYKEWHKDRLKVKPGLTGLWQVSGRSSVPFNEMVMLDLHYITHWSLGLDLKILCKTVPAVVRGEGAY